jgi:hypothetical protein
LAKVLQFASSEAGKVVYGYYSLLIFKRFATKLYGLPTGSMEIHNHVESLIHLHHFAGQSDIKEKTTAWIKAVSHCCGAQMHS